MKKIAIFQPPFLPWCGFFEILMSVDYFVFFDDVQFVKKKFLNRNYVINNNKKFLLSVPILNKDKFQNIKDIKIDKFQNWQEKHFKIIMHSYKNSKNFEILKPIIEKIYIKNQWEYLLELNVFIIKQLAKILKIKNIKWFYSSELKIKGNKDGDRAIKICKELDCYHIINGPRSIDFLNLELFKKHNINLSIINYKQKKYSQFKKSSQFIENVSVIDAIFNCGNDFSLFLNQNNIQQIV